MFHIELINDAVSSFLEEANKLTRLRHPLIQRLFDCGVENHIPFTVLDYSPATTLRERCHSGVIQPLTSLLPNIKQVAVALQYVHDEGFLHKNVRPESILLSGDGDILLSDFGIDALLRRSSMWQPSEMAELMTYIAPEQIHSEATQASDQYALGLIIYEWLSGERPFQGSYLEIAHQHMHVLPPPLRLKIPEIAPDIEAVLATALAKDPKRRFASVTAFVNALEQAHNAQVDPVADNSRATSWSVAALDPTPLFSSWPVVSIPIVTQPVVIAATAQSQMALQPPVKQRRISRRTAITAIAGLAAVGGGGVWMAFLQQSLTPSLASNTPANTNLPRKGTKLFTYYGHSSRVTSVAWSPDSGHFASAGTDKIVQVSDGINGITSFTYQGHQAEIYTVAWSPDGRSVASAGADKMVHIWDALTGQTIQIYRGHSSWVNAVSWSPDSKYIASASDDHTVQVWNAFTGKRGTIYGGHRAGVLAVAWSPDGARIASGSWDNSVQIWNAASGEINFTYQGHTAEIYAISWSPDGKRIASASGDKIVQVCDAASGSTIYTYRGHSDVVLAAQWSPDGKFIASAGYDRVVQVWNPASGKISIAYRDHTNWVDALAWSFDSKRIVSAGYDKTVQVWQALSI
ncbi:MAG: hypothetical protein NVS4B9_10390 [Ktedonobacteraceae bacterium]